MNHTVEPQEFHNAIKDNGSPPTTVGLTGGKPELTFTHTIKGTHRQQTITASRDGSRSALTILGEIMVAQDQ